MRLDALAERIGATLTGDGSAEVAGVAGLREARAGQVSFLTNAKYVRQLADSHATAVIVGERVEVPDGISVLRAGDPYYAYRQAVVALHGFRKHAQQQPQLDSGPKATGPRSTAQTASTGVPPPPGDDPSIHPAAHVDPSANVGRGTVIYPGVYVGPRCTIGVDCILYPGVVLYDDTVLGDRVILHGNTTLGHDGYGFATHKGVHHKIPQIGNVVIEDDVEVGANCSIERAATGATRIGAGSKLGSGVVVGHGTTTGRGCLLVAQTGIAGSCTLGNYVVLGGQVGMAGHLTIADQVRVGGKGGIIGDIRESGDYLGTPAMPLREALKLFGTFPNLVKRLRRIERKLDLKALQDPLGGKPQND